MSFYKWYMSTPEKGVPVWFWMPIALGVLAAFTGFKLPSLSSANPPVQIPSSKEDMTSLGACKAICAPDNYNWVFVKVGGLAADSGRCTCSGQAR